jgi:hypothetical protein
MRFLRSAWIAERVPGTRAALRLAVVVVGFHAVASCQPPAESARANPADPLPPAVQAPPSIYPQLALARQRDGWRSPPFASPRRPGRSCRLTETFTGNDMPAAVLVAHGR